MNVVDQPRAAVRLSHDESVPAHFHFGESRPDHRFILQTRVDATSYENVESTVAGFIAARQPSYVCVASVHSVMEAHDDPDFNAILSAALVVTPDGMPLVWGLRALGLSTATRVYGPELTERLCAWAAGAGIPVGFHGSTAPVLEQLIANLRRRYPTLRVTYRCSPPFRNLTSQ